MSRWCRYVSTVVVAAGLLAFLTAPAQAADAERGRQVPLRVASYNIHAGAGVDNVFDLDRQIAAIRALDADIVGLQEVDVHWSDRSQWRNLATELARGLGMRVYFGPIYSLDPVNEGEPRREYGMATLSRYPIIEATNHEITRLSTQEPDPEPEPAPGFPEIVVNVRGAKVHVYNTHLDYRGDPYVREMQVADMRRIMAADNGQKVLVGDFNTEAAAPELTPLWRDLTDTWQAANGTEGGLTYPTGAPEKRIDFVTVSSQVTVRAATVPVTEASDHLPIVADLVVTRGI